jgi:hypothetical protein
MASTKLFSYNIEDTDGRLVVTVEGLYAKSVIDYLRSEVQAGRGWRVLSQISPAIPINRLSRQAFWAHTDEAADRPEEAAEAGKLDLNTIFKQGFAQGYSDFAHGLDRFGATLDELKSQFESGKPGPRGAAEVATADKAPRRGVRRARNSRRKRGA